ncbi:PAS domain-containing protein [Mesorhizobium sp. M1227]|uniref:PAS domain-containing protein n=1 Tax=unclassified Mesorhizobium TaxID=325217 RepID=UPI00333D2F3E
MSKHCNGARAALREGEFTLRQIIETVPGLIWSNGPDGEPTHVGQRLLSYSGMRFEEFKQGGWEAFVHPDDYPETAKAFYHAIQTGTAYQGLTRLRRADGEFRWHHARCEPLCDRQGRVVQWYGLCVDVDECKRAEDQLRRSEAHLAEAQRLSHTGVSVGNESTILYFSEEAYRIWGFDPALGMPSREAVWQRIHPDDRDGVRAKAEHSFSEKTGYSHGYRIVLPDGTAKHLESIAQPVFSPSGELVEMIGTQIDVTESKHAEEALRESEYKLRQIFETVPGLLWSADPAGEPTQLNQRLLDYTGMRFEDFKHGGWEVFLHPDDIPETASALQHAIQTGTSYQAVNRLRRADGEFRWHHTRGEPLRDHQRRIVQWYGLSVDIDEAKEAEERLRRSEAYLAEAQSLSHTGSAAYNDTKILYWSDETYRIFGFDPRNGLPSREAVERRIHPDDLERAREKALRAVRQKKNYELQYRIALPAGLIKYIESTSYPKFSASGDLVEVVSTLLDVTERKHAQEEHERLSQLEANLAHMNRLSMMGELAASLAHEITQPIAAARNNARAAMHFLDRHPSDLDEIREALASVVSDSDRAGDIIDRIRDHIKKAPPRKSRFDLNGAIDEVIGLAQGAINTNGVSVRTLLTEALADVQGDRVQLQQVVLNLILNAVEAMSTIEAGPRELLISTDQAQTGGVFVSVRDSGPGIDADHIDRIFDAFYTTKSSGVGMGLSICRSIIDAHGGRLWADKNASGGAMLRFSLPSPDKEPTISRHPDDRTGEPDGDSVSDAAHQTAYEGNK